MASASGKTCAARFGHPSQWTTRSIWDAVTVVTPMSRRPSRTYGITGMRASISLKDAGISSQRFSSRLYAES